MAGALRWPGFAGAVSCASSVFIMSMDKSQFSGDRFPFLPLVCGLDLNRVIE